jgi:hypothetical protein
MGGVAFAWLVHPLGQHIDHENLLLEMSEQALGILIRPGIRLSDTT